MIKFILVQNREGKTRFIKWYQSYSQQEQRNILTDVHRLIQPRDSRFASFIDYQGGRLVYRRYAGLYFVMHIDQEDSELGHLELIQLLVEVLNEYFGNVSELNLIYQFQEVHCVVNEMITGGMISQTSRENILINLQAIKSLD